MTARTYKSQPLRMLWPVFAVLLIGALWSLYWFVASIFIKSEVEQQRQAYLARGIAIACSEETWGGFPFRFEFACQTPRFTTLEGPRLDAKTLQAVALAYNPWHVIVIIDGPSTLAKPDGQIHRAEHKQILASIKIKDSESPEVSIDIPALDLPGILETDQVLLHTRPGAGAGIEVAATLRGARVTTGGPQQLHVQDGSGQAVLGQDGVLRISKIVLQQDGVIYSGAGEFTLDAQQRLAGTLHTETNDLNGLLDILDPHLVMTDDQRTSFRAMLGLLGQNAKTDIIARDGELFVGPFKVGDLLPVR